MKEEKTKPILVRITEAQYLKLYKCAIKQTRTVNGLLRFLIEQYLNEDRDSK